MEIRPTKIDNLCKTDPHTRKVSLTFLLSYSSKIMLDIFGLLLLTIGAVFSLGWPHPHPGGSRLCTAVRTQSLAHLHGASQLGQEALALQEIWVSLGPELLGDGEAE